MRNKKCMIEVFKNSKGEKMTQEQKKEYIEKVKLEIVAFEKKGVDVKPPKTEPTELDKEYELAVKAADKLKKITGPTQEEVIEQLKAENKKLKAGPTQEEIVKGVDISKWMGKRSKPVVDQKDVEKANAIINNFLAN